MIRSRLSVHDERRGTRGWLGILVVLAPLAACLTGSGCDTNADPGSQWVAPKSISGAWVPRYGKDQLPTYTLRVEIAQNGASVSVAYVYLCKEPDCTPITAVYPASYDPTQGVLVVDYPTASRQDYFRFADDTDMYRVADPGVDKINGVLYTKQ